MSRGFGTTYGVGSTDKIETAYNSNPSIYTVLFRAWRNGAGGNNAGEIVSKRTGSTPYWWLNTNASGTGRLVLGYNYTTTDGQWQSQASYFASGGWTTGAVAVNESTLAASGPLMWKNGVSETVSVVATPSGTIITNNDNVIIGNRGNDNARNFDGMIGNVLIVNAIISDWEAMMYHRGAPPMFFKHRGILFYDELWGVSRNGLTKALHTVTGTQDRLESPVIRRASFRKNLHVNIAPVLLTTIGDQSIDENDTLSIPLEAYDLNGDIPAYTLTLSDNSPAPAWATITDNNDGTADLDFDPDYDDEGVYNFKVTVTDNDGLPMTDSETFEVTVNNVNRAPVLTNPGTQNGSEGDVVSLQLVATDPDNDDLTFTLESGSLPPGLSLSSSGLISGTITYAGANSSPYSATVRVTDDGTPSPLFDEETFTWNVTNVTSLIIDPGSQTNAEGAVISLDLDASPTTTALTWAVQSGSLPTGLTINSSTGVISGTISAGASLLSPFSATVRATDTSGSFDEQVISWTVNETNNAPVLASIGNKSIDEGDSDGYELTATDADNDTLSFSITLSDDNPAPAWVSLIDDGDGTANLLLSPGYDDAGVYSLKVTVSDSVTTDFEVFTVTVNEVDTTPVITDPGDQENDEGDVVSLQLESTDILDNGITWSLQSGSLPEGLSINSSGLISGSIEYDANDNSPHSVIIRATNSENEFDEITIEWIVNDVNRAPIVEPITNQSNYSGDSVNLSIEAEDPDEDELEYSALNLPGGLTINNSTGVISGFIFPNAHENSPYSVQITVSDGDLIDTAEFTWSVSELVLGDEDIWTMKVDTIIEHIETLNDDIEEMEEPYTYEDYAFIVHALNDIFETKGGY